MEAFKRLVMIQHQDQLHGFSPSFFGYWRPDPFSGTPTLEAIEPMVRRSGSPAGIYSLKEPNDAQLETYEGDLVRLWVSGYVVEHGRGYRSTKAAVMQILTKDGLPSPVKLDVVTKLVSQLPSDIYYAAAYSALQAAQEVARHRKPKASDYATLEKLVAACPAGGPLDRALADTLIREWLQLHNTPPLRRDLLDALTAFARRYGNSWNMLLFATLNDGLQPHKKDAAARLTVGQIATLFDLLRGGDMAQDGGLKAWFYFQIRETQSVIQRAYWMVHYLEIMPDFVAALARSNSVTAMLIFAREFGPMDWMESRLPYADVNQLQQWYSLRDKIR